ncbi:thermonuclease family protein [Neobacillus pocheonensis]|uniref:Thermonuclease family protein n=1 Tax=Neobacillus pocheonensis TaxID=363869 RepID=A0ABT0W7R6_9BACI|nr:thermonuclease family protein [Neobacillus pocheonensis]
MRKRLVGGALIAASMVLAFHPPQILTGENQLDVSVQRDMIQNRDSLEKGKIQQEAGNIPNGQVPITLVETVDGDTIKVKVNGKVEKVRYLLVDTPDSKKPGMCVQPYAKEASLRNDQLVKGGRLSLELEQGDARDSYGRLCVDGKSVQETLLKEGFARVAYIMNPPYKFLLQYREVESLAKRNRVNIWNRTDYVTNRGFNECVP